MKYPPDNRWRKRLKSIIHNTSKPQPCRKYRQDRFRPYVWEEQTDSVDFRSTLLVKPIILGGVGQDAGLEFDVSHQHSAQALDLIDVYLLAALFRLWEI